MKKLTLDRPDRAGLAKVLAAAEVDRVLLKCGGRPIALVINVEHKDEEQIELENDSGFWAMIAERRKERGGVPLEKLEARLVAEERRLARRKPEKTHSSKTAVRRQKAVK